jgi:colanic acid biosynthesis glycosyl transferase WcaI
LRWCPFVFVAQDIWPDGLISMGNLKSGSAIAAFRFLEKMVYRVASRVVVVSEGMKENLTAKGVPAAKIEVIPNWVDTGVIQPMERQNSFRADLGLMDRFVVLFAGNLGYAADLEQVLRAARLLQGESKLVFLLVGSGSARSALMRAAEEERLSNVVFVPTQLASKLSEVLAAADLSLVTLRKDMGRVSVPSKIYSYMASARAILACVPATSEAKRLVEVSGCGVWVPPDAPEILAETIVEMSRSPESLALMGQRGRQYATNHCSRSAATMAYHRLLHNVVSNSSSGMAGTRKSECPEGKPR